MTNRGRTSESGTITLSQVMRQPTGAVHFTWTKIRDIILQYDSPTHCHIVRGLRELLTLRKDMLLSIPHNKGVAPHITKSNNTTRLIMADVLIAMIPLVLSGIFFFGHHVIINLIVCVGACFGAELGYNCIVDKKSTKSKVSSSVIDSSQRADVGQGKGDCAPQSNIRSNSVWNMSCLVTGVLLALNLPPVMSIWGGHITSGGNVIVSFDTIVLCAIASVIAIVVVKMIFGGLGRNFANPAITARIFLALSISGGMILSATNPLFGANIGMGVNNGVYTGVGDTGALINSGATWLGQSGDNIFNSIFSHNRSAGGGLFWNMLIGNTPSTAVGETNIIAIGLGYGYLVFRRVIDWRQPLILIGFVAFFALIFGLGDSRVRFDSATVVGQYVLAHVMSGAVVFGAVFMATDYSTSPNTFWGNVVFGGGVALFTVLIRVFAAFPEGFSFALLIMNIITPMIDRYIYPRPFGYKKQKTVVVTDVPT